MVLDNRGFGCINRLQRATGGESFNNLLAHAKHETLPPIDFCAHAASLGASRRRSTASPTSKTLSRTPASADRTTVIVIDTDPMPATDAGGHWWDVAVPEVSVRTDVTAARERYEDALALQRVGD